VIKLTKIVTLDKLNRLKMLADWQLKQLGYDPIEVMTAVLSTTCAQCDRSLTESEVNTYKNRCENCWSDSSARLYSSSAVGEISEISNQRSTPS